MVGRVSPGAASGGRHRSPLSCRPGVVGFRLRQFGRPSTVSNRCMKCSWPCASASCFPTQPRTPPPPLPTARILNPSSIHHAKYTLTAQPAETHTLESVGLDLGLPRVDLSLCFLTTASCEDPDILLQRTADDQIDHLPLVGSMSCRCPYCRCGPKHERHAGPIVDPRLMWRLKREHNNPVAACCCRRRPRMRWTNSLNYRPVGTTRTPMHRPWTSADL